jgi:hypothetical protein
MEGVQQVTGDRVSPLSTRPHEICRETASSYAHLITNNNKEFTRQKTLSFLLTASLYYIFYPFEKAGNIVTPAKTGIPLNLLLS